jgi:ATP/ADP translocase
MARKIGLVAVFMVLVGGAWIAQSGGFAVAVAIVLIALIAVFVPIAVILREEHDLLSNTPRSTHRA